MENTIFINKALISPLFSSSKDDQFLILTIDDKTILWLIRCCIPEGTTVDKFWKTIELILPFGVLIKGMMINNSENVPLNSMLIINSRNKINRNIFSDQLLYISYNTGYDNDKKVIEVLKESFLIDKENKTISLKDYKIESDIEDKCIYNLIDNYVHFNSELDEIVNKAQPLPPNASFKNIFIPSFYKTIIQPEFEDKEGKFAENWKKLESIFKSKLEELKEKSKNDLKLQGSSILPIINIDLLEETQHIEPNQYTLQMNEISDFNDIQNFKLSFNAILSHKSKNLKELLEDFLRFSEGLYREIIESNQKQEKIISLYTISLPIMLQYQSIPFTLANFYQNTQPTSTDIQSQHEMYVSLLALPFWYPSHRIMFQFLDKEKTYSKENILNVSNFSSSIDSNIPYYLNRTMHTHPLFNYLLLEQRENIAIIKGDYFYFSSNVDERAFGRGYRLIQTFLSYVFFNDNSKGRNKRKKTNISNIVTITPYIPTIKEINEAMIKMKIKPREAHTYEMSMRDVFRLLSYFIGSCDFIMFRKRIKKEQIDELIKDCTNLIFPVIICINKKNDKIYNVIGCDKGNRELLIMSHDYVGKNYILSYAKEKVIRWAKVDELIKSDKEFLEYILAKKG